MTIPKNEENQMMLTEVYYKTFLWAVNVVQLVYYFYFTLKGEQYVFTNHEL
jgi:hypothetical protein